MTNIYRYNCIEEKLPCNINEISCIEKQHSVPGNIILKTNYGSLGSTTLDFTNITSLTLNQRIAKTKIDTTNMRNSKLLIDFTGILNLTATLIGIYTFNFALTMTCKNNKVKQTLTTFAFKFSNKLISSVDSRTLKFAYSPDNDLCEDCCCYALELTSIQTSNNPVFTFSINSGVISILAIDSRKSSSLSNMNNKDSGNTLLSTKSNISYSSTINFAAPDFLNTLNQPIAHIYMDTTFMKKPKLLLDFTGILDIVPLNSLVVATLYFTLFKLRKGSKVRTPLTTFAFSTINFTSLANNQTLKFEYSPCDECSDECCKYTLELTSVYNDAVGTIVLSISNGTFSALAFYSCLDNYNKLSGNSIFSSNSGSFFIGYTALTAGQTEILALPIISTTIDISHLNAPNLLVDFAGILHIDSDPFITLILNFTLYRSSSNDNILQPVANFVYNSIQTTVINESNTLKFEYYPTDDTCDDLCTYILELTSITTPANIAIYDITISSATLSIIAVEP